MGCLSAPTPAEIQVIFGKRGACSPHRGTSRVWGRMQGTQGPPLVGPGKQDHASWSSPRQAEAESLGAPPRRKSEAGGLTPIPFWCLRGPPRPLARPKTSSINQRGMHICGGPSIQTRRVGGGLGHLVGRLQHLHEEGVYGRVPDELEEEQVLQALEADGAQGRQAQQQLGEPPRLLWVLVFAVSLQ